MDTSRIQKPLASFIKNIPSNIKIEGLYVFGSSLRNKKNSDIDVLVVSKSFEKLNEDTRLSILFQASKFIDPEIQPWGVTPKEFSEAESQSILGSIRESGYKIN